jgi:hypothetical protein
MLDCFVLYCLVQPVTGYIKSRLPAPYHHSGSVTSHLASHVDPELSAHENGDEMLPVAYESLMETAAAQVPVIMMKIPATTKKTLSAINERKYSVLLVWR